MDKIFKALESLIPVIAGHPFVSSILGTFVVVILCILTVRAKPEILDKLLKPRKGQRHFLDSINCGAHIQAELDKLQGSTGADKVSLWLYCNGTSSISGVSYLKTKIDYISTRNGVAFNQNLMSHFTPLAAFVDFTTEMWDDTKSPKFVKKAKEDVKHPLMQSQMVIGNTHLAYAQAVRDIHGNPAGMLFLSFQSKNASRTDVELEHDCQNASFVISAVLDIMSDQKPWWKVWLN